MDWVPSPANPKPKRKARVAPAIQRKTVAQIIEESERDQRKQVAAAMMPLVTHNMGNAKANIEMALRGLSGAQADISGAVTASKDAGIEFSEGLPAAVAKLQEIHGMVEQARAMIEAGEGEIMKTQSFIDYHRETFGCDPMGVMQG